MKARKRIVCICSLLLATCMIFTGCGQEKTKNRRSLTEKILNTKVECTSEEDLVKWCITAIEDNDVDLLMSLMDDDTSKIMGVSFQDYYGLSMEEYYEQILDSSSEYMEDNHKGTDYVVYISEDVWRGEIDIDDLELDNDDWDEIYETYGISEKELYNYYESIDQMGEIEVELMFYGMDGKAIEGGITIYSIVRDDIFYLYGIWDFILYDEDDYIEFECIPADDSPYGQEKKQSEDISNAQTLATAVVTALAVEASYEACRNGIYTSDELYRADDAFTKETSEALSGKEHFYCQYGVHAGGEFTIYINNDTNTLEIYGGPEVDDYYMLYPDVGDYYR